MLLKKLLQLKKENKQMKDNSTITINFSAVVLLHQPQNRSKIIKIKFEFTIADIPKGLKRKEMSIPMMYTTKEEKLPPYKFLPHLLRLRLQIFYPLIHYFGF